MKAVVSLFHDTFPGMTGLPKNLPLRCVQHILFTCKLECARLNKVNLQGFAQYVKEVFFLKCTQRVQIRSKLTARQTASYHQIASTSSPSEIIVYLFLAY